MFRADPNTALDAAAVDPTPPCGQADAAPPAVDMFCGAGGLALGLRAAGVHVAAHLDHWQPAVDTLNANFGRTHAPLDVGTLTADEVCELGGGAAPWLIVGGPPCQSFTSAGRRRGSDPRGSLVGAYARLAAAVRPALVVFENVEGFVTAGGGRFVFDLLEPLVAAGYWVRLRKVNLANYGVPQHRKRVICVASLCGTPPFPEPTHSAWGAPGARSAGTGLRTPTMSEALAGLVCPDTPGAPQGHTIASASSVEQARMCALRPGQTMRDLPEELWHDSYHRRANRRVMDGTPTERRGGAPAGLRRLRGDEPSKAITSAAIREFVHPTEDRRLTLREAARLQTFPDDFEFCGTVTEQATLVGNAIPPRFAQVLGRSLLAHAADNRGVAPREPSEGALLEFEVTPAQQTSPALANVIAAVGERFLTDRLFETALAS